MKSNTADSVDADTLTAQLQRSDAYPHAVEGPIVVYQTHISIVFLAGQFAYKIKKPIHTDFLDYSTRDLRRHYCNEEVRLNSRYAGDLYLGVVPVTLGKVGLAIDGEGEIVDHAVKMRRLPEGALLSERIEAGKLTSDEVFSLAATVARFHQTADVAKGEVAQGWPDFFVRNIHQLFDTLNQVVGHDKAATLKVLQGWSNEFFAQHLSEITDRIGAGFVRECHGDLHLANIVHWGERLVPFDGIEFNDHLRWIDVLGDAAFLAMDLAARGHLDLSRSFINAYLEHTGDYNSLSLLRLFLFYRSLVRALAASMRSDSDDVRAHIALAYRFTLRENPQLWITHGVSGSGKTLLSEAVVQRHDAFRLRSDLERKRIFGLSPTDRPPAELAEKMYGDEGNERTYTRLCELARGILQAGYSVIVDATFLKRSNRDHFHCLANQEGVAFAILDCQSDEQTLRQRVVDRRTRSNDASDADLKVLNHQLMHRDPLTQSEHQLVIEVPDIVQFAEHL